MALSPRAHAVLTAAFVGRLAPVVALLLGSFLAEKWRSDLALLAIEPCEKQSWLSSDRACLTWTAPRAGVNGPTRNVAG
jgi:hypothetical protein